MHYCELASELESRLPRVVLAPSTTTACKSSSTLDLTIPEACGHHGTDHVQVEPVFIPHFLRQTLWQGNNQPCATVRPVREMTQKLQTSRLHRFSFPSVLRQTVRCVFTGRLGTSNKTQQVFQIGPFKINQTYQI